MDVGIGLPATIPGVGRDALLDWARRAEARGFSTLGTIDRLVYGNYEPLIALAAAAAVTERIRLATTIMIAPYRANGALVAKQAASLDRLSNGRLTLGVAVGGREDDYEASGVDFHERGVRFDAMLEQWRGVWDGEAGIGPAPANGRPRLVVGGSADVAFRRAARHGDGWIMGGGAPSRLADGAAKARAAWKAAGRDGEPLIMSLAYFALGDGAQRAAESYLGDYYAWLGEDLAGAIAGSAATDADTVRQYAKAFEGNGCDELIFMPCASDPAQVDLLAEALAS
jgi:alkanesulfonate monooxygenase SsuD/methylene tetrahydromethanopterin reductase-like flavin-dependent oxidoreductase (luciferase family)